MEDAASRIVEHYERAIQSTNTQLAPFSPRPRCTIVVLQLKLQSLSATVIVLQN
jgi:hypothetical protein